MNEEFEVYLRFERKTIENRRNYLPAADCQKKIVALYCNILKRMEKRKRLVRLNTKLTRTGEGEKQVALETISKKGRP